MAEFDEFADGFCHYAEDVGWCQYSNGNVIILTSKMKAYDQIYEVASENYGLVTTEMARKLGVSGMALVMLEKRGRVSRVGRGVYRLEQFPASEYDSYAAIVAKAGRGAFLRGPSVLAMVNLCPTDPSKLYVGVPGRVRRNLGRGVVVRQNVVTGNVAGLRGMIASALLIS